VTFEVLNLPLVLLGGLSGGESAEILALLRGGVELSGIQPVFTGFQFSNHRDVLRSLLQITSQYVSKNAVWLYINLSRKRFGAWIDHVGIGFIGFGPGRQSGFRIGVG
jgi:hypothetical protein